MNYTKETIESRLGLKEKKEKKQIAINISEQYLNELNDIAKKMTILTDNTVTRNALIEDAIYAYIKEANKILEQNKDEIERKSIDDYFDTVIFPAHHDGFKEVFMGKNAWWEVRLDERKIDKIDYIAIYITNPYSYISHVGKVKEIIKLPNGKYKIILTGKPKKLDNLVVLGNASPQKTRSNLYTTLEKLKKAKEIKELD